MASAVSGGGHTAAASESTRCCRGQAPAGEPPKHVQFHASSTEEVVVFSIMPSVGTWLAPRRKLQHPLAAGQGRFAPREVGIPVSCREDFVTACRSRSAVHIQAIWRGKLARRHRVKLQGKKETEAVRRSEVFLFGSSPQDLASVRVSAKATINGSRPAKKRASAGTSIQKADDVLEAGSDLLASAYDTMSASLPSWPSSASIPSSWASSTLPSWPSVASVKSYVWTSATDVPLAEKKDTADHSDTSETSFIDMLEDEEGIWKKLERLPDKPENRPRQIYILFSDTGGGHRASALALEAALHRQFGEQVSVKISDFIREAAPWPWNQAPELYQMVGSFPMVYKKLYENETDHKSWRDTKTFKTTWSLSKERIVEYLKDILRRSVDLIISVHPLINHAVVDGLRKLVADGFAAPGRPPVVTVVTDLGSAHFSWFDPMVDMLFVASAEVQKLAVDCGVPAHKINFCGLPVREGFWKADVRTKEEIKAKLELKPPDSEVVYQFVVLIMGGGEGFGDLVPTAVKIGEMLKKRRDTQLVVICGRNEEVKTKLNEHDWDSMESAKPGFRFKPKILGFVTNVDEYMGAADCLVTKAGPGSIAEAMIKGLPCLLTSFIPGQEEGNLRFVTEGEAGSYVPDSQPDDIALELCSWLRDPLRMTKMQAAARRLGSPRATLEIARRIGEQLLGLQSVEEEEALEEGKAAEFVQNTR